MKVYVVFGEGSAWSPPYFLSVHADRETAEGALHNWNQLGGWLDGLEGYTEYFEYDNGRIEEVEI